jgi:hypothetical protein
MSVPFKYIAYCPRCNKESVLKCTGDSLADIATLEEQVYTLCRNCKTVKIVHNKHVVDMQEHDED